MNKESLIKEYVKNGGTLWNIESISTLSDGGTKIIILPRICRMKPFYIHKDNWTIHTGYPVSDDNLLTDKPTKTYILDRLERYKENCEFRLKEANIFIDNLNEKYELG
tara:strand:- start:640 stop:963 length:324 start_codon:yes stop_codon:yes gene_type:complete